MLPGDPLLAPTEARRSPPLVQILDQRSQEGGGSSRVGVSHEK
jgi:hypothetical protein